MSYPILSETENSFERKIVYQTMHENFVVIVQQKHLNEQEDWTTKDHCIQNFCEFHCSVARQTSIHQWGFHYIRGIVPSSTLSDPLHTYDVSNLPVGTKKLLINTIATVFLSMKTSSVFCKSVTT